MNFNEIEQFTPNGNWECSYSLPYFMNEIAEEQARVHAEYLRLADEEEKKKKEIETNGK